MAPVERRTLLRTAAAAVAVRKTVTAGIDPAIRADQIDMAVTLKDGRVLHRFIEHAAGSQANPMTDAQLADKFTDLCDGSCGRPG